MIFGRIKDTDEYKIHGWWDDHTSNEITENERAILEKINPVFMKKTFLEIRKYTDNEGRTIRIAFVTAKDDYAISGRLFMFENNTVTYW